VTCGVLQLRVRHVFALTLAVASVSRSGWAQVGAGSWTVKPEWVRAHEDFLASDVLAGRGSATRDEQLAATYVASEFEGYGLRYAPGMTSYLQGAQVEAPALDGHATATIGDAMLEEGVDFDLLMSPAMDVTGPLVEMNAGEIGKRKFERGAAVLVTGNSGTDAAFGAISALRRSGAALVLLSGEGEVANAYAMLGSRTRTPIRLAEQPAQRQSATVLVLKPAVFARIAAEREGSSVSVKVHRSAEVATKMTYNALGYLPGTDPDAGTILLTAHLDHLGTGRPVNGDAIYNGANDDAAGTTAVLELAHALAAGPRPRRSILFVCYGSEEIGELGSTYFGEHSPVLLKSLVANLEFEMIGNQDPKMPKGVLLLTGWDRSNLGPELKAHGALLGPDPYPEQHFFERSDNYALALKGVVAHTAAGWGTVPTYHQPNDDLAHLDLPFMTAAIQSLVEPVRWLASSDFVPKWNPGGQPKGR
jgi:aminopeptidase YwaD